MFCQDILLERRQSNCTAGGYWDSTGAYDAAVAPAARLMGMPELVTVGSACAGVCPAIMNLKQLPAVPPNERIFSCEDSAGSIFAIEVIGTPLLMRAVAGEPKE